MGKREEKMMIKKILLVATVIFIGAETLAAVLPAREASDNELARRRLYPGGIDEEDLTVQPELFIPARSISAEKIEQGVLQDRKKARSSQ